MRQLGRFEHLQRKVNLFFIVITIIFQAIWNTFTCNIKFLLSLKQSTFVIRQICSGIGLHTRKMSWSVHAKENHFILMCNYMRMIHFQYNNNTNGIEIKHNNKSTWIDYILKNTYPRKSLRLIDVPNFLSDRLGHSLMSLKLDICFINWWANWISIAIQYS